MVTFPEPCTLKTLPSIHTTWLFWLCSSSSSSPPGEEGPPALEALCVRLAVGPLGGAGRLHQHRGHLDQLQGALTVLQGLTQVEDLAEGGVKKVVSVIIGQNINDPFL